jgi:hypothetical protein
MQHTLVPSNAHAKHHLRSLGRLFVLMLLHVTHDIRGRAEITVSHLQRLAAAHRVHA